MIEEARLQIESLQGGIITLGTAALAIIALLAMFALFKRMIGSTGGDLDDQRTIDRLNRSSFDRDTYRNYRYSGVDMKAGPKGHLP